MNDGQQLNTPEGFVPAPVLRISDVETLRILADPLRLRILEAFEAHPGHPLAVKSVAAALGEAVTKLYYHVNLLEQHGLLVVVETHLVSGIIEKRYRVAADTIEVDRTLIGSSGPGMAPEVQAVVDTVFGASRRSLEISLRSGEARFGVDEPAPDRVVLARVTERLTPAAAAEVRRLIARLIEQIRELATPAKGAPAAPAGSDPAEGGGSADGKGNGSAEGDRPAADEGNGAPEGDRPAEPKDTRAYGLLVAFHPISTSPAGSADAARAGGSGRDA